MTCHLQMSVLSHDHMIWSFQLKTVNLFLLSLLSDLQECDSERKVLPVLLNPIHLIFQILNVSRVKSKNVQNFSSFSEVNFINVT